MKTKILFLVFLVCILLVFQFLPLVEATAGEDFVDNNTSNVDNHANHGAMSNFTAEQDANILYNDTLTEADTFTRTLTPRTETYVNSGSQSSPYNIAVSCPTGTANGDMLFCHIAWVATTTIDAVPSGWVSIANDTTNADKYALFYKIASSEPSSWTWSFAATVKVRAVCSAYYGTAYLGGASPIDVLSNTAYRTSNNQAQAASMNVAVVNSPLIYWGCVYSTSSRTFTKPSVPTSDWVEDDDAWSTTPDFATEVCSMIWVGSGTTGIMTATISSTSTTKHAFAIALKPAPANYELDLEFQWTTVDPDQTNEDLCIRTSTFTGTAENIGVDVWTGTPATWVSISSALTTNQWNNISISAYLNQSTITFRFIGKTESEDTAQNTWQIECNLIHTWSATTYEEVDSLVTASVGITTNIQVQYHVTMSESDTIGLSMDIKVEESVVPSSTTSISISTTIEVSYGIPLGENVTVTMDLDAVNMTAPSEYPIDMELTASVSLSTVVGVESHVELTEGVSLGITLDVQIAGNVPQDLTASIGLSTSVQVDYHVTITTSNSVQLDLTAKTGEGVTSELTGTISLNVLVDIISGVQPNLTGTVSMVTLVQTNCHVDLSQNTTFDMSLVAVNETGAVTEYPVLSTVTGTVSMNTLITVNYEVAMTESQNIVMTSSLTLANTKALSLSPSIGLNIVFSGNYSHSSPSAPSSPSSPSDCGTYTQEVSGEVFDVKIVKISFAYGFDAGLSRNLEITLDVKNKGTISGDALIDWWITDIVNHELASGSETAYVASQDSKTLTFTYDDLAELSKGDYLFKVEVVSIGGLRLSSEATASLAFTVGDVYTDLARDNILIIGFCVFLGALVLVGWRKDKHQSRIFKRRGRRRGRR